MIKHLKHVALIVTAVVAFVPSLASADELTIRFVVPPAPVAAVHLAPHRARRDDDRRFVAHADRDGHADRNDRDGRGGR